MEGAALGMVYTIMKYAQTENDDYRESMERAVRGMRRFVDTARRRRNEAAEKFRLELLRGDYGKADGMPLFKV